MPNNETVSSLEKQSGDAGVKHEALIWLAVFVSLVLVGIYYIAA